MSPDEVRSFQLLSQAFDPAAVDPQVIIPAPRGRTNVDYVGLRVELQFQIIDEAKKSASQCRMHIQIRNGNHLNPRQSADQRLDVSPFRIRITGQLHGVDGMPAIL